MALLPVERLVAEFEKRIAVSDAVDIAVAWVGPSLALDILRKAFQQRKVPIRIVVGLSGNGTHPDALRSLGEIATVRIGSSGPGIFHPKFYLFRSPSKDRCWIGSANLTLPGFMLNSELVHEFSDGGLARQWFDKLWGALDPDPSARIKNYIDEWTRPPSGSGEKSGPDRSNTRAPRAIPPFAPHSWNDYLKALRACDAYWRYFAKDFSVLGAEWSWIDTIATGGNVIRRRDWNSFTREEVNILLGYREGQGAWGLLGSMKGAPRAVSALLKNTNGVRQTIKGAIDPMLTAKGEGEFVNAAVRAIQKIAELNGFGPAIATRFITLARPDCGISVNRGSAPRLASLTDLPATVNALANARNYPRLLQWIYRQPWYSVPEPRDSFERTLWSMRAALIDSFVYEAV